MNEKLRKALIDSNPWWKTKDISLVYKPREIYSEIKKYILLKQIIAITGLRRVGKTTLMKKIIKDFIKTGINPEKILYFSFDDFQEVEIESILEEYSLLFEFNNEKCIIFFDEIQKIENWQDKIKRIYDTYKNTKIFLSGSESLDIEKKGKESLAGRIFQFRMYPLSFKEFLTFKNLEYKNMALYKKELKSEFENCIKTGGFPELLDIKDNEIKKRYIKESIIDKIIYKDIPKLFKIDDPSILETILNIITDNPGQIIDINSLSRELGIARQSLSKYLCYLEKSFIIWKLYNYSKNKSTSEKKLKKYYLTTPILALLNNENLFTKVIENLAVIKTRAKYFWRNPQKDEVDIILEKNKKITPIEVKQSSKKELSGLLKFLKKYKLKQGFVVSREIEAEDKINGFVIKYIPIWMFMLNETY